MKMKEIELGARPKVYSVNPLLLSLSNFSLK